MKTRFLAIDLGATHIKSALVDPRALTVSSIERAPFPPFIAQGEHREVEVSVIEERVRAIVDRHRDVDGILLTGQMHGLVVVGPDGRPRTRFISWQDRRAAGAFFDELRARVADRFDALGRELRAGSPITLLSWLRHEGVDLRDAAPLGLADWVAYALCGSIATDRTNASAHGAFDVARGDWDVAVIDRLGLSDLRFPPVARDGSVVGTFEHIPVHLPIGDQQAALLGAMLERGELSINAGTGSQVSILSDSPAPATDEHQIRPFPGDRFLRTVTHIPAGRALAALARLVSELSDRPSDALWDAIAARVESTPKTNLAVKTSFFPSRFGSAGAIANITEEQLTVGHLFRGALEGMAGDYVQAAAYIDPASTRRRIVWSGGIARRFPALAHEVERRLGLSSRVAPSKEDTLLGLAVLARDYVIEKPPSTTSD